MGGRVPKWSTLSAYLPVCPGYIGRQIAGGSIRARGQTGSGPSVSMGKRATMGDLVRRIQAGDAVSGLDEALKEAKLGDSEFSCVHAMLVYVRSEGCRELYVGGTDGSHALLRVLCEQKGVEQGDTGSTGDTELEGMDMLCEYCLPTSPVSVAACARGSNALNLVALFWREFPDAALLIELGGGGGGLLDREDTGKPVYGYVLCGIQGVPETWGPFSLNSWRRLRRRSDDESVTFMAPRPVPAQVPTTAV
jgi:hypothetical protein